MRRGSASSSSFGRSIRSSRRHLGYHRSYYYGGRSFLHNWVVWIFGIFFVFVIYLQFSWFLANILSGVFAVGSPFIWFILFQVGVITVIYLVKNLSTSSDLERRLSGKDKLAKVSTNLETNGQFRQRPE